MSRSEEFLTGADAPLDTHQAQVGQHSYEVTASTLSQARQRVKQEHVIKTGLLPAGSRMKVWKK